VNLFFTVCVHTGSIAYYTNQHATTQRNITHKTEKNKCSQYSSSNIHIICLSLKNKEC